MASDVPMPPAMFAAYDPQPERALPRASVEIRPATAADVEWLAKLSQQREGGTLAAARERAQRWLTAPPEGHFTYVAEVGGVIVAHAHIAHIRPATDTRDDRPEGWYLSGVTVAPEQRRQGIATALTKYRLARIAERASEAFYFANSVNQPSIDLHAKLGFIEIRRAIVVPGAQFSAGGVGVLFRANLASA